MKKVKEEFEQLHNQIMTGKACWIALCALCILAICGYGVVLAAHKMVLYSFLVVIGGVPLTTAICLIGIAVFAHFRNVMRIRNKLYEKELKEENRDIPII